jgi:hypothetical protein
MKKVFFLLIIIGGSNQLLGQKHGFKRYQYDEFIYGLTVPKLKNIKAIADYYKIEEADIYQFNQRFENTNLAYEKGQIVYLPAGTLLDNTNVAFEALQQFYEPLPIYKINNSLFFPFKDTLAEPILISNALIADYLLTDTTTFRTWNCAYAVAKIDLGDNYFGFIMKSVIHQDSEIYLYVYFHSDFLRRIQISGLLSGDGGHEFMSATFKDYDGDGIAEILIKTAYESYNYEAVYIGNNSFISYNMNQFQIDKQTYELYKIVDGNYLNVPMESILKD